MRDPNANGDETLNDPTEGHHAPDPLTDRKAGALLLVFLAAVLVVLAVASLPLSSPDSSPDNASTHQSTGSGQLDR